MKLRSLEGSRGNRGNQKGGEGTYKTNTYNLKVPLVPLVPSILSRAYRAKNCYMHEIFFLRSPSCVKMREPREPRELGPYRCWFYGSLYGSKVPSGSLSIQRRPLYE
jgi:hypothetical protein